MLGGEGFRAEGEVEVGSERFQGGFRGFVFFFVPGSLFYFVPMSFFFFVPMSFFCPVCRFLFCPDGCLLILFRLRFFLGVNIIQERHHVFSGLILSWIAAKALC